VAQRATLYAKGYQLTYTGQYFEGARRARPSISSSLFRTDDDWAVAFHRLPCGADLPDGRHGEHPPTGRHTYHQLQDQKSGERFIPAEWQGNMTCHFAGHPNGA
jgi:hypothetical protein